MPGRGLRGFNPDGTKSRFGNGAKDALQTTEVPFGCLIRMQKAVKSDADIDQRIRNVDNEVLLRHPSFAPHPHEIVICRASRLHGPTLSFPVEIDFKGRISGDGEFA
jgi:hypothetical protein